MTALQGEATLFITRYECTSARAQRDFDRLISGSRLIETALLGNSYCVKTTVPGSALVHVDMWAIGH